MAGIKISDLPAAASAQLTDVLPVDQLPGPVTRKVSLSQVLDLFDGSLVDSVQGSANQVLVNGTAGSPQTGALTLTLPQNIATTSSPQFTAVKAGAILDSNGVNVLEFQTAVSAVNWLGIGNSATTGGPIVYATGSDSNINITLFTKGTGQIVLDSQNTTTPIVINSGTGAQHITNFSFANTAQNRTVTFQDASGTVAYLSNIPAGSPSALTKTDDTNVTLTLGGTPATALLQATSITAGWTGTLSGTRGGTGVNNGANTATFAGNLNFANSFTTSGNFAVTQTYTGVTNVTFPTSGTLATTSQLVTPAALTKTDDTNVTLTLGGSPATALVNAASITAGWTGTLSGTRGGTGVNNGASTITVGGSFAMSGAFTFTGTLTGNTAVTFPTTGTLATTAGTVSSVTGTANRITSTGGTTPVIDISASYVGQSSITTLGTITTGTWTGTTIAVANGGTGITSFGTGVATALGQNVTGSGGIALANGPTFVTSTVTAPSITFSTTSGVIGTTTNNNAAAGSVGELISSTVADTTVTLTTNTAANVTSISLTAGDWDVWGNVVFNGNSATTVIYHAGWISTTSATIPADTIYASKPYTGAGTAIYAALVDSFAVPKQRISIAGTTTVYLSVQSGFGVNADKAGGAIYARRVR